MQSPNAHYDAIVKENGVFYKFSLIVSFCEYDEIKLVSIDGEK